MVPAVNTCPSPDELSNWNTALEGQPPQKILEAALKQYDTTIILACGFGAEDVITTRVNYSFDFLPY